MYDAGGDSEAVFQIVPQCRFRPFAFILPIVIPIFVRGVVPQDYRLYACEVLCRHTAIEEISSASPDAQTTDLTIQVCSPVVILMPAGSAPLGITRWRSLRSVIEFDNAQCLSLGFAITFGQDQRVTLMSSYRAFLI